MTREDIVNLLNEQGIFLEETNKEQILELDSIAFLTLLISIEEKLGVEIGAKELAKKLKKGISIVELEKFIKEKQNN